MQKKQTEWFEQWNLFSDDEHRLFKDWIYPTVLDDFRGKTVLECGCGGGQHTSFIAPYARHVTAVDLNTAEIARQKNSAFGNITFLEDDIARMDLQQTFDIVFSIGVVHHTDDPDKTVANLKRHVKPGGKLIVWVYAHEGNFLIRSMVEPFRKLFCQTISREKLIVVSRIITGLLYIPVYSVYRLPLGFLPYYQYFKNFRTLSFQRNLLNVFDKLNAPQVVFIKKETMQRWFNVEEFTNIHISFYNGVSWRGSGIKK